MSTNTSTNIPVPISARTSAGNNAADGSASATKDGKSGVELRMVGQQHTMEVQHSKDGNTENVELAQSM